MELQSVPAFMKTKTPCNHHLYIGKGFGPQTGIGALLWFRRVEGAAAFNQEADHMKNKQARVMVALLLSTVFTAGSASVAFAGCSSKPNIFKGVDTVCSDGTRTYTKPNIFGGFDTYDKSGRRISSSKPNIFGGSDTKSSNGKTKTVTKPNIFGGKDIKNGSGVTTGYTKPNIFGGYDVYDKSGRRTQTCKPNIRKGYDCK